MRNLILSFGIMLMSVNLAFAQTAGSYKADFVGWIKALGSDALAGRKPMTEYEPKTIEYLAGEFRRLGLRPAFGDSYFQPVDIISTTVRPEKGVIPVKAPKGRMNLRFQDDVMVWTARATDKLSLKNAEYVFCGFGIDAPEYGWNDFEGVDVRGKIVIAMVNDPGFYEGDLFRGRNMTYYGRWTYKLEHALEMGAAGCLILHNEAAAGYGWHVCVNGHLDNNLALFDARTANAGELGIKGWIHEDACRRLFEIAGLDFDEAVASALKPGFRAIPLGACSTVDFDVKYETGTSCNVGAILDGTDLKDECVVYSAHWDHFGIGKPDETGDAIYNGAADNGSGMAAILMIAEKMKDLPATRRSALFLIPTCEESGLFGSCYYCDNPAFPMEKTAACINFDCVAPAVLSEEALILREGESVLDPLLIAAAAAQNRYIVFDDDNSDGWFFRSDHFNFVRHGVPAVVIKKGTRFVEPGKVDRYPQKDWYHKPNDEYRDDWDLDGALANINLMFSVGLAVGNQ